MNAKYKYIYLSEAKEYGNLDLSILREAINPALDSALKNLLAFTGRPLEEILPMLSENPANLLGIADKKGTIANGKDGDLVILDRENGIVDVFVGGNLIDKRAGL